MTQIDVERAVVRSVAVVTAGPPTPTRRGSDVATVGVFLAALLVPLGGYLFRTADPLKDEKRNLAPPPPAPTARWSMRAFPVMFEAYFNDRVGFRKHMLKARRLAVADVLGDSPSEVVWVGRDGWLFMNCVGPHGGLPAVQKPTDDRTAVWADTLVRRHTELAAKGIPYVVVVAREKSSVYPEYLPPRFQQHPPPDHVTPLLERLAAAGVPAIDCLPPLLTAKAASPDPIFFKHDSHWNDTGAFAAYQVLAAELAARVPGYRGKPRSAFAAVRLPHPAGDLAQAIGRRTAEPFDYFTEPAAAVAEVNDPGLIAAVAAGDPLSHLPVRLTETPAGPRGVLLHDSFGIDLRRLLASDFGRLACVGTYGSARAVVARERPAVVVQLFVERTLRTVDPPE